MTMENKKKYGTIPIIQGSQFGNGNKETETPLDRPRRENERKQNTKLIHTIQKGDEEQENQESGM
jgi:hypothetical protein